MDECMLPSARRPPPEQVSIRALNMHHLFFRALNIFASRPLTVVQLDSVDVACLGFPLFLIDIKQKAWRARTAGPRGSPWGPPLPSEDPLEDPPEILWWGSSQGSPWGGGSPLGV